MPRILTDMAQNKIVQQSHRSRFENFFSIAINKKANNNSTDWTWTTQQLLRIIGLKLHLSFTLGVDPGDIIAIIVLCHSGGASPSIGYDIWHSTSRSVGETRAHSWRLGTYVVLSPSIDVSPPPFVAVRYFCIRMWNTDALHWLRP